MHKAFNSRDDISWLYVSGKEGGRGLASIDDSVDTSIQRRESNMESVKKDWWQRPESTETTQGTTEK